MFFTKFEELRFICDHLGENFFELSNFFGHILHVFFVFFSWRAIFGFFFIWGISWKLLSTYTIEYRFSFGFWGFIGFFSGSFAGLFCSFSFFRFFSDFYLITFEISENLKYRKFQTNFEKKRKKNRTRTDFPGASPNDLREMQCFGAGHANALSRAGQVV